VRAFPERECFDNPSYASKKSLRLFDRALDPIRGWKNPDRKSCRPIDDWELTDDSKRSALSFFVRVLVTTPFCFALSNFGPS
jgi:hypothetical protein